MYLTNNGKKALVEAQTGTPLRFRYILMGDGDIGGAAPWSIAAVISPRLEVTISEMRRTTDNSVHIRANYTNAVVTQGFYFRELGLYADQGEGTEVVLYAYGNAGALAEYIEPQGGTSTVEKVVALNITVDNAENVTAVFDETTVFVLQNDLLDGTVVPAKAEMAADAEKLNGKSPEYYATSEEVDKKLNKTDVAVAAKKLETARTIALSGGATGTATAFDGTTNISIPITGLNMSNATAGTLSAARGGTGYTSLQATRNAMGLGNTLSVLPLANGGTGANNGIAANYVLTGTFPARIAATATDYSGNAVRNIQFRTSASVSVASSRLVTNRK